MMDLDEAMADVMPAHRFDPAPLEAYLRRHIAGFGRNMRVSQIQGGVSNPTLLLSAEGKDGLQRYVVRKKPPGALLPSAHRIDREYRVMTALAAQGVPVPHMRLYCDDASVVGTEFFLMDYLEGRVFRDARLPGQLPQERSAIYDSLNETLAQLHSVDPEAAGLGDYGPKGNYFERQIARWTKQYRAAETEHLPAMEELIRRLPEAVPPDDQVGIAHGDYRLENVMFHPTEPRVIAILDWELSTLGHPMADLAYNCFMWHSHDATWGTFDGIDFATSGIPTEDDYVAAYCRRTGRDSISHWNFYMAFGIFRLASIGQGVYKRALLGNMAMDRQMENGTATIAQQALDIFQRV
ncbi:phosphotransferase [Sphingobium sp. HBC34]|uniref:Phosphotransferase n=1 Tax=Sphingobium cyanobacteriorum TaxID=3063954 RepID=A0ABT8ZSQ3_9SPHN|nr:phosphotransferase [Sphingobium sp. HBC34]MDO7836486.1 phosphotransferase [Sphingobium sp. HBC34]